MEMQRRDFLKLSAAAGAVTVVTGCGKDLQTTNPEVPEETITYGRAICQPNCGTYCPLRTEIKDGRATAILLEDPDGVENERRYINCLRGRSNIQKNYHKDRITYPMKRVGSRGSGQFERISWEQAISEICAKLEQQYAINEQGRTIYWSYASAGVSAVNSFNALKSVLYAKGGMLGAFTKGGYSAQCRNFILPYMFGPSLNLGSSSTSEAKHSDLIVSFGFNPVETNGAGHQGGPQYNEIKKDVPIISFDPRYNDSFIGANGEHHFIRPGTDAAFIEAMIYHLLVEDDGRYVASDFLRDKCYGFYAEPEMADPHNPGQVLPAVAYEDCYEAHIRGDGTDGSGAKTPEWAAPICGIPEETIRDLAQRIAQAQAPYITCGLGLQRQVNGEDNLRAVSTLCAVIGAIGNRGNTAGGWIGTARLNFTDLHYYWQPNQAVPNAGVNYFSWVKAITNPEEVTVLNGELSLPADELDENGDGKLEHGIRAVFCQGGNPVNQHADSNNARQALANEEQVDLVVVIEHHMTATAEMADYLLPETSWLETRDMSPGHYGWGADSYGHWATKNELEPMGESKQAYDIALAIAKGLGVESEFTGGMSLDDLFEYVYQNNHKRGSADFPATYKEYVDAGIIYADFANNDLSVEAAYMHNPLYKYVNEGDVLNTSSGKIDIYSHGLRELSEKRNRPENWYEKHDNYINAIPKYMVAPETFEDDSVEFADFPLQAVGFHGKGQAHSTFFNVPWLREASEHAVWVNPVDVPSGAVSGGRVQVHSARGSIEINLKVTTRMMPGVVALPQGGWFKANAQGVDVGGCMNTLTQDTIPSAVGVGNPQQTNRVRITTV